MVRPRRLPPRIAAGEGAGRGRKSRAWEECQKHKTPTECAQFSRQQLKYGDVPKWLKGPHSKCGRSAQTGARVQISSSPPRLSLDAICVPGSAFSFALALAEGKPGKKHLIVIETRPLPPFCIASVLSFVFWRMEKRKIRFTKPKLLSIMEPSPALAQPGRRTPKGAVPL